MKKLTLAMLAVLAIAATAGAQNPRVRRNTSRPTDPQISLGELTPTPQMWMYEQQRRDHLDPKLARRRRAEFVAAQRHRRMAARKWFGFSNSRPVASHTPFTGEYSPAWRSNGYIPFNFKAYGGPDPTVIVEEGTYIR